MPLPEMLRAGLRQCTAPFSEDPPARFFRYALVIQSPCFLASSKLLPWTVTDRLLQRPFHPSSSDQNSQSIGMFAVTCRLTT
jgi:hypothetical protein